MYKLRRYIILCIMFTIDMAIRVNEAVPVVRP